MLLPIRFLVNWETMHTRKQLQVDRDNARKNDRRFDFDYQPGQKVFLTKPGLLPKLDTPRDGPFVIETIHTNGTVHIRRGATTE